MPDPSYPCNRQFVAGGRSARRVLLPTDPEAALPAQMRRRSCSKAWTPATRGVLLASPFQPHRHLHPPRRAAPHRPRWCASHGGVTIVDEIYLGLSYDDTFGHSALGSWASTSSSSTAFSKYFNMTGWRLGWLVLPPALVAPMERLAQNLFICASTIAQHAALACFQPESMAEYERRRAEFRAGATRWCRR